MFAMVSHRSLFSLQTIHKPQKNQFYKSSIIIVYEQQNVPKWLWLQNDLGHFQLLWLPFKPVNTVLAIAEQLLIRDVMAFSQLQAVTFGDTLRWTEDPPLLQSPSLFHSSTTDNNYKCQCAPVGRTFTNFFGVLSFLSTSFIVSCLCETQAHFFLWTDQSVWNSEDQWEVMFIHSSSVERGFVWCYFCAHGSHEGCRLFTGVWWSHLNWNVNSHAKLKSYLSRKIPIDLQCERSISS